MKFFLADSRFPWRSLRRCCLLLCALFLIPQVSFAQDTPSGFFPGAINIFAGNGGGAFGLTSGTLPTSGSIGGASAVAVDSEGDVVFVAGGGYMAMVYAGGTVPPILAAVTTNASTPVTPVKGDVYTIAGTLGSGCTGTTPIALATASSPYKTVTAMWFDANDNLYIADSKCFTVDEIDHATATIKVIAGTAGSQSSYTTTGGNSQVSGQSPTSIKLGTPVDVKTDSWGNVYIGDGINRAAYVIYSSTATTPPPVLLAEGWTASTLTQGDIYVFAGVVKQNCTASSTSSCPQYGPATSAAVLDATTAISIDATGNVYLMDRVEDVLRVLYVGGAVPPVLAVAATAEGYTLTAGNIYVVAGTYTATAVTACTATPCGDGGLATAATLKTSYYVLTDSAGNVYFADYQDNAIRKIDTSGYISTIVGVDNPSGTLSSTPTAAGAGGAATSAKLYKPTVIAFDSTQSNLYIADAGTVLWQVPTATQQSITFPALTSPVTYGSTITLGATASSTLAASYSVSPSASGSVSGTGSSAVLSVKGIGSIAITAAQGTASGGSTAVTSSSNPTIYYAPTTAAEDVTQTITAEQAPLTVTANNVNLTPTQLAAFNFSTGFSATITGEVNGDTAAAAYSGAPAFTTNATAAAICGTSYTVTPTIGTLTSTNYDFPNFINGTFIVTGTTTQTLSLSSSLPSSVTYGKTTSVPLSATASSGGAVTWTLLSGPATLSGSTLTITGAGTIKVQGVQNGTCSYAASPTATYTLTVNPAPLTVTAPSPSYSYGTNIATALAAIAPVITGWVGADSSSLVSGSPVYTTSATSTSDPGSFTLSAAQGTLAIASSKAGNYTFSTFAPGTITITKASQTISYVASLTNVKYGDDPTVTATASSGLAVTGTITGNLTAIQSVTYPSAKNYTLEWDATGIGAATITLTQPGNKDYAAATPVVLSFTIGQAPLDITATSFTREQGAPNPTFTYTLGTTTAGVAGGFMNNDTDISSVVSGLPILTTTATQASLPGTYTIAVDTSQMTSTNYYFVPINGTLTVGPAGSYVITASPSSLTIQRGLSAQSVITITPSNEYQGTITLACGTLPANVTCTVSPSTYTFTGEYVSNGYTYAETVQKGIITINTTSATVVGANSSQKQNVSLAGVLIPGALAGLFLVFARKRIAKRSAIWSLCALLSLGIGATLGLTSCGGSNVSTIATPGTQTITITGSGTTPSGSSTVTATVPLTVTIQ
jgi:hypothetical protein